MSFLAWGVAYIVLALAPSYVTVRLHAASLLISGATAGLLLVCAAIVQFALAGWPARRAQTVGLVTLTAGLGGFVSAGVLGSAWLLLGSVCVAGAGQGLAFMGATRQANHAAPPDQRAGVAAAFWIASYLGGGLPVTGAGFLAVRAGLVHAVDGSALALAAACLIVLVAVRVVIADPDAPSCRGRHRASPLKSHLHGQLTRWGLAAARQSPRMTTQRRFRHRCVL